MIKNKKYSVLLLLRKNSKFLFYNYNDRNFLKKKIYIIKQKLLMALVLNLL